MTLKKLEIQAKHFRKRQFSNYPVLFYGDKDFTTSNNFIILNSTREYILDTKTFDEPLSQ